MVFVNEIINKYMVYHQRWWLLYIQLSFLIESGCLVLSRARNTLSCGFGRLLSVRNTTENNKPYRAIKSTGAYTAGCSCDLFKFASISNMSCSFPGLSLQSPNRAHRGMFGWPAINKRISVAVFRYHLHHQITSSYVLLCTPYHPSYLLFAVICCLRTIKNLSVPHVENNSGMKKFFSSMGHFGFYS